MTEPTRTVEPQPAPTPLTEERIRIRAYELYEKRHGEPGDAVSDWYQAVAELESETTEIVK